MAGTPTPIFAQTLRNASAQILPADTTSKKSLSIGAPNGTRLEGITAASTDTVDRDIVLWMNNGSIDQLLATITIPANSGNSNAIPAVDLMNHPMLPGLSFDAYGNKILLVSSGWSLKVSAATTLTAGKQIDVVATSGGDY